MGIRLRRAALVTVLSLTLIGATPSAHNEDIPYPALASLSLEEQVSALQALCTQLSNGEVVFTCEDEYEYAIGTMVSQGFEVSIALVDVANLVLDGGDPSQYFVPDDATSPTALQNYLDSATRIDTTLPAEEDLTHVDLYPIAVELNITDPARLESAEASAVGWYKCGSFFRPLPRRANLWVVRGTYSDPAGTLRSWGYHPTPGLAGGGWTRPQTYQWWWCGWRTFRDHAYINLQQIPGGGTARRINEQNYDGTIPGEPNPEVWRSGPWPYSSWPAYVAWWHRTR